MKGDDATLQSVCFHWGQIRREESINIWITTKAFQTCALQEGKKKRKAFRMSASRLH